MKKLLIFMLVLGMASMANATLSLNVSSTEPNAGITGVIESPVTIYLVLASNAPIAITKGGATPSMGAYSGPVSELAGYGVVVPALYTLGEYWIMGTAPGEPYKTGNYLIGAGEVGDEVYGGWFDEVDMTMTEIGHGTLIPEPMTIALLGLGGLLLRRRK